MNKANADETGNKVEKEGTMPPGEMVPEDQLRRRNVVMCPSCDAWQPRLIRSFCVFCGQSLLLEKCPHCQSLLPELPTILDHEGKLTYECIFCHKGIESLYEAMKAGSLESAMKPKLSEEETVVREMILLGVKDSTFTEAWIKQNVEQGPVDLEKVMPSVGGPGPDESFHQCPICSSYISSIAKVNDSLSTVMFQDMVSCPRCNWEGEFKSVEWENGAAFFTFDHLLLKGRMIAKMDAALVKSVRAAKAQVAHMGLFGAADEFDEEPKWPSGVAAAIVGTAGYIGQKMDDLVRSIRAQTQPYQGPRSGGKGPGGKKPGSSHDHDRGQGNRGQGNRGQSSRGQSNRGQSNRGQSGKQVQDGNKKS